MDYLFIEKCARELDGILKGKTFRGAKFEEWGLKLAAGRYCVNFLLKDPNAIYLSDGDARSERFKRLHGSIIRSVSMLNSDRIINIELLKLKPSGKGDLFSLIVELTGRNANAILLKEGVIVDLFRPFEGSHRSILKGKTYEPPPLEKREFDEITFGKVTAEGIERNLYRFVKGISPLNSKEIALMYDELGDLRRAYTLFMERHEASREAFLYLKGGKPYCMTTFPYRSMNGLEFRTFRGELPFLSCWRAFSEMVEQEKLKKEKESIRNRLIREREALMKRLESSKSPEELVEEAERFRRTGELLKYNLPNLKDERKPSVKVFDFSSGEEMTIEVDPKLSLKENVDRFFRLYRKLKRKAEVQGESTARIRERLSRIDQALKRIEEEGLPKELEAKAEKRKEAKQLKSYRLSSGREIVVGRSSRENDFVSLKFSNPWDIWFHTRDIPGSHVILRLESGEKPDESDIVEAASAAAYFSRGRDSGKVKVDFTYAKYLKKPKGAPSGFITYRNEKTLSISSEIFKKLIETDNR